METKELDVLNRGELFEELREKCKSFVEHEFYGWIICICGILLILLFFSELLTDYHNNMLDSIIWIVFLCMGGLFILLDFRFLKKFDNLDTPDRLLYWFEKRHRYNFIVWLVSCILITCIFLIKPSLDLWAYVCVAIGIVIVVILFFYCGGPLWYRKEKEIIEQLRELIGKK